MDGSVVNLLFENDNLLKDSVLFLGRSVNNSCRDFLFSGGCGAFYRGEIRLAEKNIIVNLNSNASIN